MANTQLSILNPVPTRMDGPELLHDLVPQSSASGNPAIEYASGDGTCRQMSYQQLHTRSNALAAKIHRLAGFRESSNESSSKNLIVPCFMPQSPELYVSQLAILKAGGAFCPLALDTPEERLRFILQDIEASVVLTVAGSRDSLACCHGLEIIEVDESLATMGDPVARLSVLPSQPAYVMYTSGSTGTPKGVLISHSAVTQALLAHDRHIPLFSRFLQFASPTFDVSVFEVFFPLFRGVTLVSCDRRLMLNDLPGVINRMNVDAVELTPSVANGLLSRRSGVPPLKLLLTIGEMLKRSVVEEFGGNDDEAAMLYGMYGPTEATIHCTLHPAAPKAMSVRNIGQPFDTVSAFIIEMPSDNNESSPPEILPVGEEGELAIGGFQLAEGYLNRPKQTSTAFFDHPTYGRLYRTGDLCIMTNDGLLECRGRISGGQIKLRGQRMELGEVEYAATRSSSCKIAVAEVVNGTLVVFCVRSDPSVTVIDVSKTCKRWLPAFMIPEVVMIESVPYLPSGKVDHKALCQLYTKSEPKIPANETVPSASRSHILQVIENSLHIALDKALPLSAAGLDSLSAIRIASQLRRDGYPQVDAIDILEARSVYEIEKVVDLKRELERDQIGVQTQKHQQLLDDVLSSSQLGESRDMIEDIYPCTPLQTVMLSETRKLPTSYCNWIKFEANHIHDDEQVCRAIEELAKHHELLRAGFVLANSGPAVVVWKLPTEEQIKVVPHFNYEFSLQTEVDYLRPCLFQVMKTSGMIHILLKIHHSLYDQWSIDMLKQDLSILLAGKTIDHCPRFRFISDFYDRTLQEARSGESIEYWQENLLEVPITSMPNLNGRSLICKRSRSRWEMLQFDITTARQDAGRLGYSLPSVFQAAFSWILASYVGSTDIVFGTVLSGRHLPAPDIEEVFGPCLLTLPCRVDISTVRTCLDLVRLTHAWTRAMQHNALTPLTEIKSASGCPPEVPLFDTIFVWQESTISRHAAEHSISVIDAADQNEFNLVLEIEPVREGVQLRATYEERLLSVKQVNIMLQQLSFIAKHMMSYPNDVLRAVNGSLPANLLSISNPRPSSPLVPVDLMTAIEQQVQTQPHAAAIVFAPVIRTGASRLQILSYTDLNVHANKLANFIHSLGVSVNSLVSICMEKSLDLYISILAVIKAGAGYLPLTPDTPKARIKHILREAQVKITLCDHHSAQMLQDTSSVTVIDISIINFTMQQGEMPKVIAEGSSVAYTVYTSGSTGTPKGVIITRDNLSANLAMLTSLYKVQPGERLLQACSQAFDVSAFEIFFSFSTGMCLCSAPKEQIFRDIEHSIRELGITHLSLTPTVAALIDPENVPSVRFLVTSGEGVTESVRSRWAGHGLHQGYGPSETTNIVSLNMNMQQEHLLGNIGKPFANTSAFVIAPEEEFRLLPTGGLGELVLGGGQVFRGYLGHEDLNADKIVSHPSYGRLYRSGDLGRILHDGTLLIAGRIDDQVKFRGNRVELGEINAVILSDPRVLDCASLVETHRVAEERLLAFFVPRNLDVEQSRMMELAHCNVSLSSHLFELLESTLPSYMIPDLIFPITKMPLTTQGKLDKRLLKSLVCTIDRLDPYARTPSDPEPEHEWSRDERILAKAFAEAMLVPLASVGQAKSFYALGLNSLNAIRFAKAAEMCLRKPVTIGKVLRHYSVRRLAAAMAGIPPIPQVEEEETDENVLEIFHPEWVARIKSQCFSKGLELEKVLPCTPLQDAMISASAASISNAYINTLTFDIYGDISRLKQCWSVLIKRHEILRTHFVPTDSNDHPFAQVVVKRLPLPWHELPHARHHRCDDLSSLPNLEEPLKIQFTASGSHKALMIHMHHAIYDGVAISVLLKEVEQVYLGKSLPAPLSNERLLTAYYSHNSSAGLQFWAAKLLGYQPKPLRIVSPEYESEGTVKHRLAKIRHKIETFCQQRSITPLIILQAAWAKTLSCAQHESDICFGSVVSGRSSAMGGLQRLVFPCFNTIPIRVDLRLNQSNLQLLTHLRNYNSETVDFQYTSLRHIQTCSSKPQLHLFDTMLLLQPESETLDREIWMKSSEQGNMGEPVVMEVIVENTDYLLSLHHVRKYLDTGLAKRLIEVFHYSLADIMAYPSGSVHSFQGLDIHAVAAIWHQNHNVQRQGASDSFRVDSVNNEELSPAENDICAVLASRSKVKIDDIGKSTPMYRLGLDSLNAPQIAAALCARGYNLMATDIIECQTPAEIASRAMRADTCNQKSTQIDLHAFEKHHRASVLRYHSFADDDVEVVRPCTPAQIGMVAQSLETDGKLYINHITHEVPEGISYVKICHAWGTVQAVHPMLRVGFCKTDNTKHPFIMAIRKVGSAALWVEERNGSRCSENEELALANRISHKIHMTAWSVSVFSEKRPLQMTLSIHHALYDAESLRIIFNDFKQALFANFGSTPFSVDHLLLASLCNSKSDLYVSENFWKDVMQDARYPTFPDLNPDVRHDVGTISSQHVCKISVSSLKDYCKQENVTVQAVGQAIWFKLLCAYTAEPTVVFGTVLSTRSNLENERTVFPAICTVPVFCKAQKSIDDQIQAMAVYNTKAYRHRCTSLMDIKRSSGAFKGQLFDTIFVFQREFEENHCRLQWPLLKETSNVDYAVSLEMEMSSSNRINLHLYADGSRVPHQHAKLILEQFEHFMAELLAPANSITRKPSGLYSILPAKQTQLPSTTRLLHEFVRSGAEIHPEKSAFYFVHGLDENDIQTSSWSYKQLDQRGNQIAQLLCSHGVRAHEVVAVRMNKCPEATFAFLGILKAGCAFLALDPELPEARQKFILDDSSARLILVDKKSAGNANTEVLNIIIDEQALLSYSTNPVDECSLDPNARCYSLYTSGSTGTPKGCEITHENAVQAMMAFQKLFKGHWDEYSRWLQFASYWFDVSILEQFWSWSVGIAVVGAPRDLVLQDLAGFIQSMKITHIDLTPSLARLLHPKDVSSLHHGVFIVGGEALKQDIVDVWGQYNIICNGYGPTEATIGVTMNPFIGNNAKPSNIGKQFDNVGSFVLSPDSEEPVLRGAVGELCVSGKLVGKGYLNQRDLTEKAFPYLKKFNERIYRTGDLCRLLFDGSFNFIGRKDTQAKLRGQRLEISEIDAVIAGSKSQVLDVASMVIKIEENREQLVSFITSNGSELGSSLELDLSENGKQLVVSASQACKDHLPGYMVPSHIIPLRSLPLTANNKLDNKAIIAFFKSLDPHTLPNLDARKGGSNHWTRIERCIQILLSKMLNIAEDSISRNSNIFSLGVSSVSAITFSSLLKREGFSGAHVAVVMQNATITSLAFALAKKTSSMHADDIVQQARLSIRAFSHRHRSTVAKILSISDGEIETITPCTPLQEGLIIDSVRDPDRPYFNHFRYSLMQHDLPRLQDAFQLATDAIELLRSKFLATDEGFAQVIMKKAKLPWTVIPLGNQDWDTILDKEKTSWLNRNDFQLLEPIRIVTRPKVEPEVLAIFVHHALYDGTSWQYVLEHVEQAYMSLRPLDCGPAFTCALPYGPLQRRPLAKDFWRNKLDGLKPQSLPPISNTDKIHSVECDVQIGHETQIEEMRKLLGVSVQAVLQVCFEVTVRHHFPATQTYGQIVSGRSIDLLDSDRVTGPLFNTLPLPISVNPAASWAEEISRINKDNIAALPFHHTALRDIRRWCRINPSKPMFNVLFAFQHESTVRKSTLFKANLQMPQAEYPLAFEVTLNAEGAFLISIIAQRRIADRPSLDTFAQTFQKALHVTSISPNAPIGEGFHLHEDSAIHQNRVKDEEVWQSDVYPFKWSKDSLAFRSMIAQIAEVDVEKVDEKTTIFALGLDSIDAVRLSSKAKAVGILISVSKIIKAQTIPNMLGSLEAIQRQECVDDRKATLSTAQIQLKRAMKPIIVEKDQIETLLPATPNQEALVATMLRTNWRQYYNHDILRVNDNVDIVKLESSWQDVIDRNPILRTGFVPVDDPELDTTFAQVIYRPRPIKIQEIIAKSFDSIERTCGSIADDMRTNYQGQPLLRLTKVLMNSDRYLILSLAHALYDGHSLALIHNDVRRAYHNCHLERPSYNFLIEDALKAKVDRTQSFWRSTMSGASPLSLPVSAETPVVRTHRMEMALKITAREARAFCRTHRVSMQALSQCCWALLLSYYTCCLEVVFGIVLACRDNEDAERVMFPTMNTVPIRVMLHGTKREMVQHLQDLVSNMREYQHTSLRQIQAACANLWTSPGSGTLFDTLFIHQHQLEQGESEDGPLYESVGSTSDVEYPVAAEMETIRSSLIVRVACKSNFLDMEGTKKLLDRFDQLFSSIIDTPDAPTVIFQEDTVLVCNLMKFRLQDSLPRDERTYNNESTIEDQTDYECLPIVLNIRQALAQVSKVPLRKILFLTTIESIGIDSISAIKVATILQKQSINLSVSDILRARHVGQMAQIAADSLELFELPVKSSEKIVTSALEEHNLRLMSNAQLKRRNIEKLLPATAGQVYMLSLWQISNGQLFHPTFNYKVQGDTNPLRIRQAWDKLIALRPILRTRFLATGSSSIPVVQVIFKSALQSFESDSHSKLIEFAPITLLEISQERDKYTLKLKIHHALYDAVSLRLLIKDLSKLLSGGDLDSSNITYADFLALSVSKQARASIKAFWTSYLMNARVLPSMKLEGKGTKKRIEILRPGRIGAYFALDTTAKKNSTTVQALFFAAFAKVYATLLMRRDGWWEDETADVILGVYLANRTHLSNLTELCAPTLNLVPLLVRSPMANSLLQVTKQIQTDMREIGTPLNSAVGLWEIADWTGVRIQSFVNFLKLPEQHEVHNRAADGVRIVDANEGKLEGFSRIVEPAETHFQSPSGLETMQLSSAYEESLEIEAILADGGALTVGLFCPEDMLGMQEAHHVLQRLQQELTDVTQPI